jgi:hypothetical protein
MCCFVIIIFSCRVFVGLISSLGIREISLCMYYVDLPFSPPLLLILVLKNFTISIFLEFTEVLFVTQVLQIHGHLNCC